MYDTCNNGNIWTFENVFEITFVRLTCIKNWYNVMWILTFIGVVIQLMGTLLFFEKSVTHH